MLSLFVCDANLYQSLLSSGGEMPNPNPPHPQPKPHTPVTSPPPRNPDPSPMPTGPRGPR